MLQTFCCLEAGGIVSFPNQETAGVCIFSPFYLFTNPVLSHHPSPPDSACETGGSVKPVLQVGIAAQTHGFQIFWEQQRFQGCFSKSNVCREQRAMEVVNRLDQPCCSLATPEDTTHPLGTFTCLPKMLKNAPMGKVAKGE